MGKRTPALGLAVVLALGVAACNGGADVDPEPEEVDPIQEPDAGDDVDDEGLEGPGGQQDDFHNGAEDAEPGGDADQ